MKKLSIALALTLLVAAPLLAGVVYEIEVKDHESPSESHVSEVHIEGKNLKMSISEGSRGGSDGEMIFRGDRREMVVVDHDDKSYIAMDAETIQQLAGQVGSAVSQMNAQIEEALKNVPEGQRARIREMMERQMPKQAQGAAPRPKNVVKRTSDRATKNGYPCVKYEVTRDGRKVRELWVTDWDNVEGGREVQDAFVEMSGFFQEMVDAFTNMAGNFGGAIGDEHFLIDMKEIDGFPVVTSEFGAGGKLESESTLRSASRRTLDPDDFEPPSGYKRRSMGPQ